MKTWMKIVSKFHVRNVNGTKHVNLKPYRFGPSLRSLVMSLSTFVLKFPLDNQNWKNYIGCPERLVPLGIRRAQSKAPLEPFDTIVLCDVRRVSGGLYSSLPPFMMPRATTIRLVGVFSQSSATKLIGFHRKTLW